MVCFKPIRAFYPLECDNEGKRYLKFGKDRYKLGIVSNQWLMIQDDDLFKQWRNNYDGDFPTPIYYSLDGNETGLNISVPCGKCIGCRLDYSRQWALRSVHEAQMHNHYKDCSFVTLTFNNDMLLRRENPHSLNKKAFSNWIKRLRKAIKCDYGKEIRLMACGEYGAKHSRPHYHMLIYGFNFPDKRPFKYNRIHGQETIYYRSDFLERLWRPAHSDESYGFSVIGDVNFESSAYVARYVTKKLFANHPIYQTKEQEFLTTSRMPGLGFEWLKKFYRTTFERGFLYNPKGFKAPIPRYYVKKLEEIDIDLYNKYRMSSFHKLCDNLFIENLDCTKQRLMCREELKKMKLDLLVRQYEFS